MKIFPPEIKDEDIPDDDPFKNDILNRKQYAEFLTRLVGNTDEKLVLAIDAQWGEGKTTFVKMWKKYLEKKGFKTIYFDAFAHDYYEEPFISVVGEISEKYKTLFTRRKSKVNNFKKAASKVGVRVLSTGIKAGVSALTAGLINNFDLEKIAESSGELVKTIEDAACGMLEEQITSYKSESLTIESFKKQLAVIADDIKEKTSRPLIFFVDELDRCKPDYALNLLEKIKHLFFVENIIFVLVVNKEQLEESVKCVYGREIQANTYLQKFINIEFKLPLSGGDLSSGIYKEFCLHTYNSMSIKLRDSSKLDRFNDMIIALAEAYKLSLRDIQRHYSIFSLYIKAWKYSFLNPYLMAFLIFLKIKRPLLFNKLKSREFDYDALCKELDFFPAIQKVHKHVCVYLREILIFLLQPSKLNQSEQSHYSSFRTKLNSEFEIFDDREVDDIVPKICKNMDFLQIPEVLL